MPNILPENLVVQRSVPIYGITQLGLRSHPTGSSTLEALTTLSFIRSDKPFFNTPAFRPCSPCYPTQAVAEPIVSHIRNPYLTFPGGVHHFHRRLDPGLGRPHGGFSDCGCMDPFRTRAPHQCTGAKGGNIGPQSLGYSITWPSCFDCCRQHHCCSLHQQTRWDPFPPPVAAGSGSVSVASDSGHNSKSQTHSGLPKCDSRPLVSAEPAHHDRVESPPRSHESDIQTVENSSSGQVCHSPQHASSPVHGSSSGEPRALAIDALSQDWQGRSMYMFPPFLLLNKVIQKLGTTQTGEVILIAPWWPSQPWFPHLLRLSVDHLLRFFLYRRDLLSQQGYISSSKSYHLHAWRLLCSTTKQQYFQGRSLSLPQLLHVGDPPQIECTLTGGYASLPGLQGEDFIRLSRVTGPV